MGSRRLAPKARMEPAAQATIARAPVPKPSVRGSWGVGPNNNRPGARRKKLEYSWWARPAKSHLLTSSPPQAARIPTASRFVLPRWLRWVPPTIAATTNFRLHFKCLDNRGFGYILRWLDGEGPYILGLKTPRLYGPPGKAEPSCGVIRYNRTSMADRAHLLRMPCDYVSGSLFQSVSELGRQVHGLHDSEGEGFRRERSKDPANSRAGRKTKAAMRQASNKRSRCVR